MENSLEKRKVLADYVDNRVAISGAFERLTVNKNPKKPYKVALLQDVEVTLSGLRQDIGHVWVQHAETMTHCREGDRVHCTARVIRYKKSLHVPDASGATFVEDFSLSYPNNVRIVNRPVALTPGVPQDAPNGEEVHAAPPPDPPAPPAPHDPLALLLEVKAAADRLGGTARVAEVKEAIDRAGGWEAVLEVKRLADQLGGWDRLQQLLSLLK